MNKPKFYSIIIIYSILLIIAGFFRIIYSLPIATLYSNIKQGGISVESDKVYISAVMPSSPAAEAELLVGDNIVSVNSIGISVPNDLIDIVRRNSGKSIDIVIERSGELKQIQLTPRVNTSTGEGSIGVTIDNLELIKEPIYTLIPKTILQNISWSGYTTHKSELEGSIGIYMRIALQKEYFRPFVFILGIILIVLAIGLIKLKKWAIYGMFILAFINLAQMIVYFSSAPQFDSSILVSLVGFFVSILFIYYLYSQRKFFE